MSANQLVSITPRTTVRSGEKKGRILLVKPPYFTPWTPPLGIAILKSFLAQHGYAATCYDFNVDPELWGMHHKYFATLQTLEDVSINDGYSKLWWILNAHMLAFANGADAATCSHVLETIIPLYGIRINRNVINALLPLVEKFFRRLEELMNELDLSDFSTVGTSTYTTSLAASLFFLKKVKQKYPHIKTVMGGGVFADDLALGSDNLTTLVEEYSYVDHAVLGEGEMLLLKLLEGELAHKRVISIADLKGNTLSMKDVPIPDFSDLDFANYWHLTIEGARSCPFQCSFCSETIQWGDYRKKPMDLFTEQVIELSRQFKSNAFFMGDSLMNPYIAQFANALLEKNANIVYDGYLRADKPVTHRDRLEVWARSGLYRVRLGIESASARVLDSMDKMTSPKVISDVLKALANSGIRTTTYWIVGFPGETEEDFEETCEFIRQNHRYIYELEAHPYYYYPYGQIGSRLHQCRSLYPDDVTDVIKFKVWDIIDSNPPRYERYERLRKISSLASELGLPNIYSMSDRYKAEDRWHLLHPLATEVYEGTRASRKEPQPQDQPLAIFSNEWTEQGAGFNHKTDAALCYAVSVAKRLDEFTLESAIDYLLRFNEMLQVNLVEDRYVPAPQISSDTPIVSVYDCERASDEELQDLRREIAGKLSLEMQPQSGASFKVALLRRAGESSELLLLVHRAIADSHSLVLLCEDLFRAYEQLAHNKEVSLRPLSRSYSDFIADWTKQEEAASPAVDESLCVINPAIEKSKSEPGCPETQSRTAQTIITLDQNFVGRMRAKAPGDFGVRPVDALVCALVNSLAEVEPCEIHLTQNHRLLEDSLKYTVSALTRRIELPLALSEERVDARNINHALLQSKLAETGRTSLDATTRKRVFLNLECLVDEPWLGGDQWTPKGFLVRQSELAQSYSMEITPLLHRQQIEFVIRHDAEESTEKMVEAIKSRLAHHLEAVLAQCENYAAAKEYWLEEFGPRTPEANIEIDYDAPETTGPERGIVSCDLDFDVLAQFSDASEGGWPSIGLAAYATLLSRLSGREDVVVLVSVSGDVEAATVPLRLKASWELSFAEMARQVDEKLARARAYQEHAFRALSEESFPTGRKLSETVFDVGYCFSGVGAEDVETGSLENFMEQHWALDARLDLVLEFFRQGTHPHLQLNYRKNRFSRASIEKLAACLSSILEEAAQNSSASLGEIALENRRQSYELVEALARDDFNF